MKKYIVKSITIKVVTFEEFIILAMDKDKIFRVDGINCHFEKHYQVFQVYTPGCIEASLFSNDDILVITPTGNVAIYNKKLINMLYEPLQE